MTTKGLSMPAIQVQHTDTSTGSWDGPATEARIKNDAGEATLRKAFAWVDPQADSSTKAAYRFIHHEVDGEGDVGAANITACRTGIAVLNGARGGTTIPAGDRRGVYNHLAAHIRDAGLTPPDLRADPLTALDLELMIVTERRFTPGRVEVRASSGGARKIGGYAAVFNATSGNLGGFVETIAPSAFARSRNANWPNVICRYNHSDDMLLGTTQSGTLRISVDDVGLFYEVEPPQARNDIIELVSRGDIQRSSFAFKVEDEVWGLTEDSGYPKRTITGCQLIDVAPVISPAYLDTTVGLRSLARFVGADEEEVRRAADENDLRRYLSRSRDGKKYTPPSKRDFGPAARMALLGRERDPWADQAE